MLHEQSSYTVVPGLSHSCSDDRLSDIGTGGKQVRRCRNDVNSNKDFYSFDETILIKYIYNCFAIETISIHPRIVHFLDLSTRRGHTEHGMPCSENGCSSY